MTVIPGFFIISGWVTKAELYTNGSQIINLPIQSDMNSGRRWIRPANAADIVKPARLVDTPTGQRFGYGGLVFTWPMQGLSPKMVAYLQNNYFGAGSNFFERAWSKKLTVQTFNRATGEWEAYHVIGRFPNLDSEAEPALGGYNNFQIFFTAYAIAPEGADMSIEVTLPAGSIYLNSDWTFIVDAENVGDEATFDDVVFTYTIPNNFVYVSATSSSPIILNYSINNGLTYSGSPPVDLADVTNIKVYYSDVVLAGQQTSNINITLTPSTISASNNSVISVTTAGDGTTGTKSNTSPLTIVAWLPLAVSGLRVWLNGGAGVYSDTGGTVAAANTDPAARWGDQSGNVANSYALQSTLGNRPIFKTGGANGQPYLEFLSGSSRFMALQNSAVVANGAVTVAFVVDAVNNNTSGVEEYLIDWPIGVSDQLTFAHIDGSAKTSVATYRTNWTALFQPAASGLQAYTFINRTNGSSGRRFYHDGVLGTDFASTTSALIAGAMLGSSRTGLAAHFNGKIYEVIVYTAELTGQNLTNLNNYLINKYGI